jgi:hypothetical protein
VRVNAPEIRDRLHYMRATIPGEINHTRWIVQDRQTCCDSPLSGRETLDKRLSYGAAAARSSRWRLALQRSCRPAGDLPPDHPEVHV